MNFKIVYPILFILCLYVAQSFAQRNIIPLNTDFNYEIEKNIYNRNTTNFTAFKPLFIDESINSEIDSNDQSFLNKNLLERNGKKSSFILNPIIHFQTFSGNSETNVGYGGGISTSYSYANKLTVGFDFAHYQIAYPEFQRNHILKSKTVSSQNEAGISDNSISSQYISAFVNYAPSKIFDFQLGYGRNFIGDGYRSLLLSDHTNAYPYLRINTKIWKLRYTNLFSVQNNLFPQGGSNSNRVEDIASSRKKYSATHFLDFKATKWLTIGLFETVIWQGQDSIYERGYDVNYLNPVIFYRPVEFSTGSADNVLIGLNLKVQPSDKHIFYTQIVLDEFLMDEMRADFNQARNPDDSIRSGWWANKYGIQIGWHAFDLFKIEGLETRLEYNLVRPFTYAHSSPDQSYSHSNLPLAHPMGANFQEAIAMLDYYWKRWRFHLQYNYSNGGESLEGTNFGNNILTSNSTRYREYENQLGQGVAFSTNYTDINVSYLVQPKWKLYAQIGYLSRNVDHHTAQDESYVYFKLSTTLFNQYFDY